MRNLVHLFVLLISVVALSGCAVCHVLFGCNKGKDVASCDGRPAKVSDNRNSVVPAAAVSNSTPTKFDVKKELTAVFFELNKAELTLHAKKILSDNAKALTLTPNAKVVASAYCDSTGSKATNLKLGAKRAAAVKGFLSAQGVKNIQTENLCERGGDQRKTELRLVK